LGGEAPTRWLPAAGGQRPERRCPTGAIKYEKDSKARAVVSSFQKDDIRLNLDGQPIPFCAQPHIERD
jgi:hypothetical protein